jgi:hypothetical protein
MDELDRKNHQSPSPPASVGRRRGGHAALIVVNYVVFVSPQTRRDRAARLSRSPASTDQLVKKRAIARDLTRYRVEVERLKQRLNEALTLLPNEAEIPELLAEDRRTGRAVRLRHEAVFEPQSEQVAGLLREDPGEDGDRRQLPLDRRLLRQGGEARAHRERHRHQAATSRRSRTRSIVFEAEFVATTFKFVETAPAAAAAAAGGVKPIIQK